MERKEQARRLWEMSFDDDPSFTEFYFKRRYTDDNTISIDEDGTMLSVMQMLPYPFSFLNEQVKSGYVSGACTAPEQRNRGLMHQLLQKSLYYLYQRDIPICTLIPAHDWLFGYYGKSGFETIFYNQKIEDSIPLFDETNLQYRLETIRNFDNESYHYLQQAWLNMDAAILHSEIDFKVVLSDLFNAGGAIYTVRDANKIVGIALAFYYKEKEAIFINELFTNNHTVEQFLINQIGKTYNSNKYIRIQSANNHIGNPFGMLRIVKPIEILSVFAHADRSLELHFKLIDEQIEENNGYYDVRDGIVSFNKECPCLDKKAQEISINTLARTLFLPLAPHMSLMLD